MYNSMILKENFGNQIPPRYMYYVYFPYYSLCFGISITLDTMEPGGFICIRLNPFHMIHLCLYMNICITQ